MKKVLPALLVIVCVVTVAVMVRMRKAATPEPVMQAPLPEKLVLGKKTVFEMKYRSLTDEEGAKSSYGGLRVEPVKETDSPFIAVVKAQTENSITAFKCPSISENPVVALEFKEKDPVSLYFDVDMDGKLSAGERLEPADIPVNERMPLPGLVSFVTPDFQLTVDEGRQVPFKVLFRAYQVVRNLPDGGENQIQLMGSPYSLYEGTARVNGQDMTFRLYPGYRNLDYSVFGESMYILKSASAEESEDVWQSGLSSLIFRDGKYYRILIDDGPNQTLKLTYAEDKGPRGTLALDFGSEEENLKYALKSIYVQSAVGKAVRMTAVGDKLPVGSYVMPNGLVHYGLENTEAHSASFRNVPAFTVQADQTTTVKVEKAQVKISAVKLKKRREAPQTEFVEGTPVYLGVSIANKNGINVAGFSKKMKPESRWLSTQKSRIRITDAEGKEIVNKELEYG